MGMQLWMQNEGEYWILEDIFLSCYILRILILHFIIFSSCTQCTFMNQVEYCGSVYYSDWTNYVDPHTIITIFSYLLVVGNVFPYRWICIFCVRFSLLTFLSFYLLYLLDY
jgi:hypothetical protein